jgi:hypothetical protein
MGAFLLIVAKQGLKIVPALLAYGSIIISSLSSALFHDLLIWLIMLAIFVAIRFKPTDTVKIFFALLFVALAFTIQIVKTNYRLAIFGNYKNSGITTFNPGLRRK